MACLILQAILSSCGTGVCTTLSAPGPTRVVTRTAGRIPAGKSGKIEKRSRQEAGLHEKVGWPPLWLHPQDFHYYPRFTLGRHVRGRNAVALKGFGITRTRDCMKQNQS
nr:hypothetical 11.9K protein - flame chlorosis virus-like agent [Flame chlorosis virus-like agent]